MEHSRIPNSLKKYRRSVGLSQKDVAVFLGVKNSSCISCWEKGLFMPSVKHLLQLSLLFKTLPHNLYIELWEELKDDVVRFEKELLAQHESIISNERYYL